MLLSHSNKLWTTVGFLHSDVARACVADSTLVVLRTLQNGSSCRITRFITRETPMIYRTHWECIPIYCQGQSHEKKYGWKKPVQIM